MIITHNTKVTLGLFIAVLSPILGGSIFIKSEFDSMRVHMEKVMLIEDAQNWSDEFEALNPSIKIPKINKVVKQRRDNVKINTLIAKPTI